MVFLFSLFIISCNDKPKSYYLSDIYLDTDLQQSEITDTPDVKVYIMIPDSDFKAGDDIPITVSLTSTSDSVQKILFEKPGFDAYGLWRTSLNIEEVKTGNSVIKYNSKGILNSKCYMPDELKKFYQELLPGKSVSRTCKISDLTIVNNSDNRLMPGTYKISVSYYNKTSNEIVIEVM
ncbi:MAG: hypothetical protein IM638_11760 [Bacteroidetes bacterium]|nr:hypothetical protein [Bacteroidota bacterium]